MTYQVATTTRNTVKSEHIGRKLPIDDKMLLITFMLMFNTDSVKIAGNISIFGIFMAVALLYYMLDSKRILRVSSAAFVFLSSRLAFIVYLAVTDLARHLSVGSTIVLTSIYSLLPSMIMFFLIMSKREASSKELLSYFYFGIQIHCIYGLLQYILAFSGVRLGNIIVYPGLIRVSGLFSDANLYGYAVLMALGVSSYRLLCSKNLGLTLFYLAVALSNFILSIATASRTTIILALLIVPLVFVVRFRKSNTSLPFIIVIVVVLLVLFFAQDILTSMNKLFEELGRKGDIRDDIRFSFLWARSLEISKNSPLIGSGNDALVRDAGFGTHNFILTLLVDRGIIGLTIYLLPIIISLYYLFRKSLYPEGIIIVICYLLAGLGISNWVLRVPEVLLFLMLNEMNSESQAMRC